MKLAYPNLLSPFKVGNVWFRNRIITPPMGLHALQGGEPYPTEALMATFANRARGGAAVVTVHGAAALNLRDGEHLTWDARVANNRHYLAQFADAIHFYGAKASMELTGGSPDGYFDSMDGLTGRLGISKAMTPARMEEISDSFAECAHLCKQAGFDMCMLHMAYGAYTGGGFISPAINRRTDEYGGSPENRLRYPMMIFDKIKRRCGRDFLIELRVSGEELQYPDGLRTEDWKELSELLKGHVDLLQVHSGSVDNSHCTCFTEPNPFLAAAEKIRKNGCALPVVAIGGFQDLDAAEAAIADGKADLICIGRGMIADPNLGIKAYEGRNEDVVPCIKCMRCHDSACIDNRSYVCSVNPTIGLEHKLEHMIGAETTPQKVAVVGGGPAGMEAALVAKKRGHDVTLFEKDAVLGGQLNFADYADFKYALKKFKNFLIRQIEKSGVELRLGVEATPGLLEAEGFDQVLVSIGAEPLIPPIPGADGEKAIPAPKVFGHEDALGGHVVVIGGGQVGCEAALHLSRLGKRVTLLEMQSALAPDASVSYRDELVEQLERNENVTIITGGRCTGIGERVGYADAGGALHEIAADGVVLAAGMRSKADEAAKFFGCAKRTQLVGDCGAVGNVEKAMRSAFSTAVNI